MKFVAKKAVRTKRPMKLCFEGLSGGGKTFTALRLAFDMIACGIGKRVVLIDTENESAQLYAGTQCDGQIWDFEHVSMPKEYQTLDGFTEAYTQMADAGFDIIIMDSVSHAWYWALNYADQIAKRLPDKRLAWAEINPMLKAMFDTLTDNRAHCIATMRVKSDFQLVDVNGKPKLQKVGTKADQKGDTDYEFDMVWSFDKQNNVVVDKVRGCTQMNQQAATRPGPKFWKPYFDWWTGGAEFKPEVKPDSEAFIKYNTLITNCKSMDELKNVFVEANKSRNAFTVPEWDRLVIAKDAKKTDLSSTVQDVTTPPNE